MKNAVSGPRPDFLLRLVLFSAGAVILVVVYVFQRTDLASLSGDFSPNLVFIVNRSIRLILNDLACLLIISALFPGGNYLKIAFWVFLVEFLIILPAYLVAKLILEGPTEMSSPLLSQVHRLIVNPMLMILLIVGFFYQRLIRK